MLRKTSPADKGAVQTAPPLTREPPESPAPRDQKPGGEAERRRQGLSCLWSGTAHALKLLQDHPAMHELPAVQVPRDIR